MRMLSAEDLLAVWERGLERRPFERALLFLEAASLEGPARSPASMSIGDRDDMLLKLREQVFGIDLSILAPCPQCREQLESTLQTSDLRGEPTTLHDLDVAFGLDEYTFRFRAPNSEDIAACASMETGSMSLRLLRRCMTDVRRDGRFVPVEELSDHVIDAAAEKAVQQVSGGGLQITLTCPACAFQWEEPFDIVSFFWMETDAWARRLLRDVHALASSYGWAEHEILALSPLRRERYLEMIGR